MVVAKYSYNLVSLFILQQWNTLKTCRSIRFRWYDVTREVKRFSLRKKMKWDDASKIDFKQERRIMFGQTEDQNISHISKHILSLCLSASLFVSLSLSLILNSELGLSEMCLTANIWQPLDDEKKDQYYTFFLHFDVLPQSCTT